MVIAGSTDGMAKEVYFRFAKYTLSGVDDQTVIRQFLKELPKVLMVLFGGTAGNQVVIMINKDEVEATANTVNKPLKGLCGIPDSKRHVTEFKEAKDCYDGSLGNVIFVDWDLVM